MWMLEESSIYYLHRGGIHDSKTVAVVFICEAVGQETENLMLCCVFVNMCIICGFAFVVTAKRNDEVSIQINSLIN